MFEDTSNGIVSVSVNNDSLFCWNKAAVFPPLERPTKDSSYLACVCDHAASLFLFTAGIKQEGGAACVVC